MPYNRDENSKRYNKVERGGWYCTNPKKHDETETHHAGDEPHQHQAERNDSAPNRNETETRTYERESRRRRTQSAQRPTQPAYTPKPEPEPEPTPNLGSYPTLPDQEPAAPAPVKQQKGCQGCGCFFFLFFFCVFFKVCTDAAKHHPDADNAGTGHVESEAVEDIEYIVDEEGVIETTYLEEEDSETVDLEAEAGAEAGRNVERSSLY